MNKIFLIAALFFLGTIGFSSCKKVYRCECRGGVNSPEAYKPGTEGANRDSCEKAGCKFTEY